MDMKKILQNLDSAEKGEFKGKTDSSEMKTILESLQSVQEGYPMPAPPPTMPVDKGNPVSMNISLNASGKEHVEDLISMMKNAGLGDAKPVAPKMMPMRMDMERLRDIVDEPEMDSPCGAGADNRPDEAYMDTEELLSGGDDMHKEKHAADIRVKDPSGYENVEEEDFEFESKPRKPVKFDPKMPMPKIMNDLLAYQPDVSNALAKAAGVDSEEVYFDDADLVYGAKTVVPSCLVDDKCTFGDAVKALKKFVAKEDYANEPDEKYGDHNQMINDLSGGLNRKKKMFKKAQDGDNAIAVESIKAQLYRALAEKKAKPDFLDMDGDGDKKEPMKKAIKDKKAKK